MALPVRGGIAPAERKEAIDFLLPKFRRAIAHRRKIGHQAEIPEQEGDGEISADCKDVPDQWRAKLWPNSHGVRIWDEPVENPGSPKMEQRHRARAGDRK